MSYLPKKIGEKELQPGNGLLNTPDSCTHSLDELEIPMLIYYVPDPEYIIRVTACCMFMGVVEAAKRIRKSGEFYVRPACGFEWCFEPCKVRVQDHKEVTRIMDEHAE